MKWLLALFLTSILYVKLPAQEIKKVTIDELNSYINKSSKPLVINFWATWCGPCVAEMPYLVNQTKALSIKGVELVLVSLDFEEGYPNEIKSFLNNNNYIATNFWLNESDASEFCPKLDKKWEGTIPVTLMVNNLKNYRRFYGSALTPKELQKALKSLTEN